MKCELGSGLKGLGCQVGGIQIWEDNEIGSLDLSSDPSFLLHQFGFLYTFIPAFPCVGVLIKLLLCAILL